MGKSLVSLRHFPVSMALASVLIVSGCDENGEFSFPQFGNAADREPAAEPVTDSVQLIERDVEAPEVFEVTEPGLWDGRPSLGGVWVAHPDVTEPERVIIRNEDTGAFVIGALFRRERENPGPTLQVSSDAAAALEMLAGAPQTLQVTALRREEVEPEPVPDVDFDAAPVTEFDAPSEVDATPIDPTPVETATLVVPDAIATAAAAIDAAEAAGPSTDVAAEPVPTPSATPSASTAQLEKPFIQLGIFSVEANATGTADRMRSIGIVPTVLQQESQGRTFWRVIVGPTTSEAERSQILSQVQAQGFEDAYFVTN